MSRIVKDSCRLWDWNNRIARSVVGSYGAPAVKTLLLLFLMTTIVMASYVYAPAQPSDGEPVK